MNVLFINLDFPDWRRARSWSYAANLAFEEGFRANDIHFMTIPAIAGVPADDTASASFLGRIRELCSGRRFDQVWVELVHSPLDERLLEYLATLAPVRLGLLGESLQYTPDVYAMAPHLRERRSLVENRLRYMTHALVGDERDVERCNSRKLVKAMWWVSAVPERFIVHNPDRSRRFRQRFPVRSTASGPVGWNIHRSRTCWCVLPPWKTRHPTPIFSTS